MEDMYGLMAAFQLLEQRSAVKHASERFDKRALLQLHDDFGRELRSSAEGTVQIRSSVTDPISSGGAACSAPLEKLNPISFDELKVGEVHRGRVVYGMLCADAHKICSIVTLLEDNNGLAVRLEIYNVATSGADVKRLYPKGATVAVKEPYFKVAADDGLIIRVDNPANVVKVMAEKGKRTESLLHVDVEDMRKEGNRCFREQNWEAAAEYYTRCIDAALIQVKEGSSNANNSIVNGLLLAYSNRAETWLQIKEFKSALEDSDDALRIDPGHLKTQYRKGRALLGLRRYGAACECLKKAYKTSPGQREIQAALGQAKTFYAQSLNGKYDISDYLLGRGSTPPEVADFVGSVEIKMTEDGRGRGLYATRKIKTGQLLLVSNAVAVVYDSVFANITTATREDHLSAVVCAVSKSQRLLRQVYSLQDSPMSCSLDAPAIDLFKTESPGEQNENLVVDVKRIRDIIGLNAFGGTVQMFASKSSIYEANLRQQDHFHGLWLLPSFINHSCLPNSSWLEVGSAMFIHASKPIERGEEITIPYFDVLVTLPQRQARFKNWAFMCKCRRCILEHSFRTSLEPIITQRFDELISARCRRQLSDVDIQAGAEYLSLCVEAEEIIRSSHVLKTEEERLWIRASFVCPYLVAATVSRNSLSGMLHGSFPSWDKIMEVIQTTAPGDILNLKLAAGMFKNVQLLMGDENEAFLTQQKAVQAREACIRVFGKHSEDVLKAFVLEYSTEM